MDTSWNLQQTDMCTEKPPAWKLIQELGVAFCGAARRLSAATLEHGRLGFFCRRCTGKINSGDWTHKCAAEFSTRWGLFSVIFMVNVSVHTTVRSTYYYIMINKMHFNTLHVQSLHSGSFPVLQCLTHSLDRVAYTRNSLSVSSGRSVLELHSENTFHTRACFWFYGSMVGYDSEFHSSLLAGGFIFTTTDHLWPTRVIVSHALLLIVHAARRSGNVGARVNVVKTRRSRSDTETDVRHVISVTAFY